MVEQILSNLFKMEIPLPGSPLKAVNSYFIRDPERSLIIDTGMNREECLESMLSNLEKLKVDLSKTDFFITHLHADHLGLVGKLATEGSKIYFSEMEAFTLASDLRRLNDPHREFFPFFLSQGFPEDELQRAFKKHPGYHYSPKRRLNFHILKEGDSITYGGYSFECIETPGHTPGHMCLYEPQKKILVCGDHILIDITPNITFWPELENALKHYLASLEKVSSLSVDLVLPGHRRLWNDHRGRIVELKEHHENRLDEVLIALKDGDKTAWEVAPHITWDIKFSSWAEFPPVQKWFAIGETIAHINYLEADQKIWKRKENGTIFYSMK